MPEVLVAEDEAGIRTGIAAVLESEGYRVREAPDGEAALAEYARKRPDLVLLDVMMPKKSGWDVCTEIRRHDPATPIVMLTAKGEEADKVIGLGLGADDYMTKPFGFRELLARVAAALRRANVARSGAAQTAGGDVFDFSGCEVDARKFTLRDPDGNESGLGARELSLLKTFAARPDEVLSRDFLLDAVWGVSYCGNTRTLDQHVAQLRKKLGAAAVALETVHGIGYRWRPQRPGDARARHNMI